MTEVGEEKLKGASENANGEAEGNLKNGKKDEKDTSDLEIRTCQLCERVFKTERAKKIHEVHCKRKKIEEESKRQDESGESKLTARASLEFNRLKEELTADMEAIRVERRKLMDEKNSFLSEMKEEQAKLKEEMHQVENSKNPPHSVTLDDDSELDLDSEIAEIESELEAVEPEVKNIKEGTSEMDLDELTIELENLESEISTKVDFAAMKKMAEDFESQIKIVENKMQDLNGTVDNLNQELEDSGRKYGTYQHIIREMKKLDEKNEEILEEIGFGESMNVSKIPPNILESVYETTIEDIVIEIRKNQGSHDAEEIINRTLEDIRTRTSGSELFYFDGRRLSTRNLAKAISGKLISAKQVQTTYDELLSKLLEYLPGYKAKNFRAMIKLKSQEYAVDKSTLLLERFNLLKEDINHIKNMVGSVSNRQNTIELEINNIQKSTIGLEEAGQIKEAIKEFTGKLAEFEAAMNKITEEQHSQYESIRNELETITDRISNIKGSKDSHKKPRAMPKGVTTLEDADEETPKEDDIEEEAKADSDLSDLENKILNLIPEKGFTQNRIVKEIGEKTPKKKIEKSLQSLLDKKVLSIEKRGRHTIYIKSETNGGEK
jgi:DNA repair exonuclease SbcCD ATPase subunit